MAKAKPVPEGFHTVTPYLVCKNAAKAIEFYTKALGAQERFSMPGPGGAVMHAELQIGDSIIMLSDENPAMGAKSPQTLKGTAVNIFLYVPDVDALFKRATGAGATPIMPPADMFWGDRYSKIADPFGHEWSLATHFEDVAPEEMEKRAAAAFAKGAGQ